MGKPGVFACPVWKRLHQRFVVFSHAMTGREMQPLLAHERNLQGANFSQAREFRWEEFQEALGRFFRNTCKKCEIHRTSIQILQYMQYGRYSSKYRQPFVNPNTHTHTHAVFVLLQEFRKTTDLTLRKFTWNLSQTPHVPPVRGGHRQGAWFFELQGFRMISFDCSTDFDTPQTKNGLDVGL